MEPEHHATLAPSAFPTLQHCAHYRPSGEESESSRRGTRIHEVTAEMLRKAMKGESLDQPWLKDYEELQACFLPVKRR